MLVLTLFLLYFLVTYLKSMNKFFEDTAHAALYAKYRPELPNFIALKMINFMKKRSCDFNLAMDVGCGNGQSTQVFSPYFSKNFGS